MDGKEKAGSRGDECEYVELCAPIVAIERLLWEQIVNAGLEEELRSRTAAEHVGVGLNFPIELLAFLERGGISGEFALLDDSNGVPTLRLPEHDPNSDREDY